MTAESGSLVVDLAFYGTFGLILDNLITGDPGAGRLHYRNAWGSDWAEVLAWERGEVSTEYAEAFALLDRMVDDIPCNLSDDGRRAVSIMRGQTARLLNQGIEQTSAKGLNERGVYFVAEPESRPLLSDVASQFEALAQHIERLCARERAADVVASFQAAAPSGGLKRAGELSPWVWLGAAAMVGGVAWAVIR